MAHDNEEFDALSVEPRHLVFADIHTPLYAESKSGLVISAASQADLLRVTKKFFERIPTLHAYRLQCESDARKSREHSRTDAEESYWDTVHARIVEVEELLTACAACADTDDAGRSRQLMLRAKEMRASFGKVVETPEGFKHVKPIQNEN